MQKNSFLRQIGKALSWSMIEPKRPWGYDPFAEAFDQMACLTFGWRLLTARSKKG